MNNKLESNRARRLLGAAATMLIAIGSIASAQPFTSPAGTVWDAQISGSRKGLAVISFDAGTLSVTEIVVPNKLVVKLNESRGTGGNETRNGGSGSTNVVSVTNWWGAGTFNGVWSFDVKGHVIGTFNETVGDLVNPVSFVGTYKAGAKPSFTLVGSSPLGSSTYRGKPAVDLGLDLTSVGYYGQFKQGKHTETEFFHLSTSVPAGSVVPNGPNIYGMSSDTDGAAFPYVGVSLVSNWKKIAYVAAISDPANSLRSVYGSFNGKKVTGSTAGWQQADGGAATNNVSFKTFQIPTP